MDKSVKDAIEWLAEFAESVENAKPKTIEEWEAAYNDLLAEYGRLRDAAEFAWNVSLPPGVCAPTWRGEDDTHRQIISTAALDRLHEVLWGE